MYYSCLEKYISIKYFEKVIFIYSDYLWFHFCKCFYGWCISWVEIHIFQPPCFQTWFLNSECADINIYQFFRTKSSLWILKCWCLLYLIFVCFILNYGCVLYFCFFTFLLPLQSIITCTFQLLEVIIFIIKTTLKHQNINKGKCS